VEKRDFVFDAYDNQGWMSIFEESVHVAINLTIETAKVVFRVIAIMHWLCAKRGLGCAGKEAGSFGARVFRKSSGLTELVRAFEDARIIQLQGENVKLKVLAGERQQRAKLEALTDGGGGLADEISRAERLAHVG
jgi:hypothetical protein